MKKNNDKIEIESVALNVGDVRLKLTPAQCRELYNALGTLLGQSCNSPHWWYGSTTGTFPLNSTLTSTANSSNFNLVGNANGSITEITLQ